MGQLYAHHSTQRIAHVFRIEPDKDAIRRTLTKEKKHLNRGLDNGGQKWFGLLKTYFLGLSSGALPVAVIHGAA